MTSKSIDTIVGTSIYQKPDPLCNFEAEYSLTAWIRSIYTIYMPSFSIPDICILETFAQAFSQEKDYSYEMYEKLGDSALNYVLCRILKDPPFNLINESSISISADRIKKTKGLVDMAGVLGITIRYPNLEGNIYEDMMEAFIGIVDAVSGWEGHVVLEFIRNVMLRHSVLVDCSPIPNSLFSRFMVPYGGDVKTQVRIDKGMRYITLRMSADVIKGAKADFNIKLQPKYTYYIREETYAVHGSNLIQDALKTFLMDIDMYGIMTAGMLMKLCGLRETSDVQKALAALVLAKYTILPYKGLDRYAIYGYKLNGGMHLKDIADSKDALRVLILAMGREANVHSGTIKPSNYGIDINVLSLWKRCSSVCADLVDPVAHSINPKATKTIAICSGLNRKIYWHSVATDEVFDTDMSGHNTFGIPELAKCKFYYSPYFDMCPQSFPDLPKMMFPPKNLVL